VKIGTRGSQLARWQAEWVRARLAEQGVQSELVVIKTQGDAEVDRPLDQLEGTGFFTKALEDALLDGRIDVAVHSQKDLPLSLPKGLVIGAVPKRHDARDALVNGKSLQDLGPGTRVGTSSTRRITQVRFLRPDLELVSLRGNVNTRVQKVESRDGLDVAVLAVAGLERLGLGEKATPIDPLDVMPAPGQGALAIEVRMSDDKIWWAVKALNDQESEDDVEAERMILAGFGGGCQAPIGAWVGRTDPSGPRRLYGRVTATDGSAQCTASAEIDQELPIKTGEIVWRLLDREGASILLAR
jgi:hydroxymethylbilane synthase